MGTKPFGNGVLERIDLVKIEPRKAMAYGRQHAWSRQFLTPGIEQRSPGMRLKLPVPHCVRQVAERAYGLRFGQAPKGSAPNALVQIPSFNLGGGREYLAQRQVCECCGIGIGFDRICLANLSPRGLTGKARLPIRSNGSQLRYP